MLMVPRNMKSFPTEGRFMFTRLLLHGLKYINVRDLSALRFYFLGCQERRFNLCLGRLSSVRSPDTAILAFFGRPCIETRDCNEARLTNTRCVLDLTPSTLSLVSTVQWQNRRLPRSVALIRHGRTLAHSSQASPDAAQETGWTGVEKYIGESDASEMKVLNDEIDAILILASNCCPTL